MLRGIYGELPGVDPDADEESHVNAGEELSYDDDYADTGENG